MSGRAIGPVIRGMAPSATAGTGRHGMMLAIANGRCTATPVTGAGAALRTYRRAYRGIHKHDLHPDGVTYEAMVNAKRITPDLIRRMCLGGLSGHTGYT